MENSVAIDGGTGHSRGAMRGSQVRAARELLGMTREELSEATGVSRPTLRDIEAETGDPRRSSMEKVRTYLTSRGIRFMDEPGMIGLPPPDRRDPQQGEP